MSNKHTVNAYELPHHFHAHAKLYNGDFIIGGQQEWAETENELYACIEADAKHWDDNPNVREINCSEIMNGNVIRTWTLQKLQNGNESV